MVMYGAISTKLPTIPSSSLFGLKTVSGVGMLGWRQARPDEARADIAEVTRRWQTGDLRPIVHATHPLTDVARIHQTLDARTNLGRLVATP
jgi:NADPH2:quinone reductase